VEIDLDAHGLTEEDAEKMISDVVYFFLVEDQKKSLINRPDIMNKCGVNKKARAVQEYVMMKAKDKLMNIMGIRVKEVEGKKGGRSYILVNELAAAEKAISYLSISEKETARMGIIFSILGLIFMENGSVSEEDLFSFLERMGMSSNPELAEIFDGDVKKYINDVLVTKQHYLRKVKKECVDAEQVFEYMWGDRADAEVKKSDVLKMVSDVFDCAPKMFNEQYEKVKNEEGLETL